MFRHRGPVPFGVILLGVFLWEVLFNGNVRRWQVWSMLPAMAVWLYGDIMNWLGREAIERYEDPSWWYVTVAVFCPLSLIPYLWFAYWDHVGTP